MLIDLLRRLRRSNPTGLPPPGSCSRVRGAIHPVQVLLGDLGVDLRRGDGSVSQQLLDDPYVGAVVEQMRGEAVPKDVRRHAILEADRLGRLADYRPGSLAGHPPSSKRQEQRLGVIAPRELCRHEQLLSLIHISEPTRQAEISY